MERRLRRGEWIAAVAAVIAILFVTLWPSRVDAPADGVLAELIVGWHAAGVPAFVDYDLVQAIANVVLFLPLGAFVSSLFMRPLWWVAGVAGLTLSLSVELMQVLFLPARLASAGDLATNTGGALLGGAIVAIVRRVSAHRRYRRLR